MSFTVSIVNEECVIRSLTAVQLTADILSLSCVQGENLGIRAHGSDRDTNKAVMVLSVPNSHSYDLGIIPGPVVDGVQTYHPRFDHFSRGQGLVDYLQFPPFDSCSDPKDYLDRFAAVYRLAELKEYCDENGLQYEIVATEEGELAIDVADSNYQQYVEPALALA